MFTYSHSTNRFVFSFLVMEVKPPAIIPNPMTIENLTLLDYSYDTTEFVLVALPKLKTIVIGPNSFGITRIFQLENLKELRSVVIGSNSFIANGLQGTMHIVNCNSLASIRFNDGSFAGYQSIELRGLPSLVSIVMGDDAFVNCRSIVIESRSECEVIN